MKPTLIGLAALAVLLTARAQAIAVLVVSNHTVDGTFTGSSEWDTARATVSKTFFPVAQNGSGGAYLYAEKENGSLYLMYDYVNSPNTFNTLSFFDVFFQVAPNDYVVRISPGSTHLAAYEKATGTPSPVDGNGDFVYTNPPWTFIGPHANQAQDDPDFALASFQSATGFGTSPDSSTPHFMAEFALTVNGGQQHPGLYSPAPAFWSAGASGTLGIGLAASVIDPPISSGIFTLNADGTTLITPVHGLGGGPAQQPQDVVPEPGTLALGAIGIGGLIAFSWRRRRLAGNHA